MRIVWQTVRRIANEILGVKGLKVLKLIFYWSTGVLDPDQEMIDLRMNAVKHKILILSGKGGNNVL